MSLFTFNVYQTIDSEGFNKKLDFIIQNQKTIMAALDDLKAKLAVSDEKITILTTATEGVTADVAFIKAKLDASPNGIDAAGVAELNTLIDAQSERLTAAADKLTALDAETDSTQA